MPGTGKLVLIIDDDVALSRLVEKGLRRLGYLVEWAGTAREGLDRVAAGPVDAIVLDHYLPDRDGLQVLQEFRERNVLAPIIYLSGVQDPAVAVSAIKAGAADYVTKDVNEDFLTLLDHTLKSTFKAANDRIAKERAEAELRESLQRYRELADERALLIREVHHRVGNSLAIVASLLRMQQANSKLPEVSTVLVDAELRVQAIANVQANLYTQDSMTHLRLDQYLASIVEGLRKSLGDGRVTIQLDVVPVAIDADRAVSLGLLVTELLINAKKHAYPQGSGEVRVKLTSQGEGQSLLSVEDDGVGAATEQPGARGGIGKRIVAAMASKLGGALTYEPKSTGTRAVLEFPL